MPRVETFQKDKVLENIMHVFWEKGYNGTSMQDIVDATGLNRSSLYNSFGDKKALYQEALSSYGKFSGNNFKAILSSELNPLEKIYAIFESFLPEILSDSRGCMAMNCTTEMAHDQNIKTWLDRTRESNLKLFKDLIEQGQKQGVINTHKDSDSYAWHVMNSFQGYRMTGILEKDERILKSIIDNALQLLK